eukprot:11234989-Alexandrium_andersonii.AAC.1
MDRHAWLSNDSANSRRSRAPGASECSDSQGLTPLRGCPSASRRPSEPSGCSSRSGSWNRGAP